MDFDTKVGVLKPLFLTKLVIILRKPVIYQ